ICRRTSSRVFSGLRKSPATKTLISCTKQIPAWVMGKSICQHPKKHLLDITRHAGDGSPRAAFPPDSARNVRIVVFLKLHRVHRTLRRSAGAHHAVERDPVGPIPLIPPDGIAPARI